MTPLQQLQADGLPLQLALEMIMFHHFTHFVAFRKLGKRSFDIYLVRGGVAPLVTEKLGTGTSLREAAMDALKDLSAADLDVAYREVTS